MADKATETPAPAGESKADKFKRLAISRTEKALAAIANLRGLANKGNYEYTDEQVAKIFGALEGELTKLQNAFKSPGTVEAPGFTL